MGLFSRRARSNASSLQGYQSTGLSLCCSRYGLCSAASRFGTVRLCYRRQRMRTLLIRGSHEPPDGLRRIVEGGSTEVAEVARREDARGHVDRIVEWNGREVLLEDRRLRWPEDEDELRMLFE